MAIARYRTDPILEQDDDFQLHFIDGLSAVAGSNLDRSRDGFSLIGLPRSPAPAGRSSIAKNGTAMRTIPIIAEDNVPAVAAIW